MSWFNSSPVNPVAGPAAAAPTTPPKPAAQGNDQYRMALANALMQSGMEPTETKKAGGFAVPTSPWDTLSKLGQSAVGAYMMKGQ